jgi:hypothetical protein
VRKTLAELTAEADRLSLEGWLSVTVPSETPDLDLSSKVRKLLPNALRVDRAAQALADPDRPRRAPLTSAVQNTASSTRPSRTWSGPSSPAHDCEA